MLYCGHRQLKVGVYRSTDCVNASSVNKFKNKIDKYLRRVGYTYMNNLRTLDKPMASLFTDHLGLSLDGRIVQYCPL